MHKKQQKLLDEALAILQALDFPRAQRNERSALTFLALLNLTSPKTWKDFHAGELFTLSDRNILGNRGMGRGGAVSSDSL